MEGDSGTTRLTNNSLSASFFVSSSAALPSTTAPSVVSSVAASVAMPVPPPTSTITLDPAFVAAVASAVQAVLAPVIPQASSSGISPPSSNIGAACLPGPANLPSSSGGVPVHASGLEQRTSSFLASGVPFNAQSSPQPVAPQGRQMLSVPSFISTFAPPRSAIPSLAIATGTSPSVPSPVSSASLGLPSSFQQPFVLPPGFTPVPAKTVSQMLAGKFIDLGDLLSANITEKEPESQVYFGGQLVVTPSAKKHRRKIDDIVSWSEAFSIFTLILTSYFPHRWKDLTCYKLLILQTHRHFSGRVWRAYDLAFRQHAAATKLVDWSSMNSELFNFHAAGASLRPGASGTSPDVPEPSGAPSSQIICRSWNRGRCSSQYNYCRYAHRCSLWGGPHRCSECSVRTESASRGDHKRSSPPPPASAPPPKARRH